MKNGTTQIEKKTHARDRRLVSRLHVSFPYIFPHTNTKKNAKLYTHTINYQWLFFPDPVSIPEMQKNMHKLCTASTFLKVVRWMVRSFCCIFFSQQFKMELCCDSDAFFSFILFSFHLFDFWFGKTCNGQTIPIRWKQGSINFCITSIEQWLAQKILLWIFRVHSNEEGIFHRNGLIIIRQRSRIFFFQTENEKKSSLACLRFYNKAIFFQRKNATEKEFEPRELQRNNRWSRARQREKSKEE